MLHGRVVRPRGQGAYPYNSNVPVSVDAASIAHIPGAQVVQVNNFLGVVAPKEYDAIQAAAQLKVVWNTNPILPGTGNLWKHYRDVDAAGKIPATVGSTSKGNVDAALASAAHTVSGTLQVPLPGPHADRPELCGRRRAGERGDDLEQHPERRRTSTPTWRTCSRRCRRNQIRVLFYEGAGSFGNGCVAFDTAESAAIMSKARRQAGAPAVDALGRARLDALRAGEPVRHAGRRRRERQHRRRTRRPATARAARRLYTGRELVGPGRRSDPDRERPPDAGQRRRREHGEQLAVDEGRRARTTS